MKRSFFLLLVIVLVTSCTNRPSYVVRGDLKKYHSSNLNLPPGADTAIYNTEIYGPNIFVEIDGIPKGEITIELDLIETGFDRPGKRTFSVFYNNQLLTPQLDIYKEAGGENIPLVKTFDVIHPGGTMHIRLEAIENNAKFNAIRIMKGGKVLAYITAKDAVITKTLAGGQTFRVLTPGELTFYNADHAPVGAYTSLVYGYKHSGGFITEGGRITSGNIVPGDGLMIAFREGEETRLLPFAKFSNTLPNAVSWLSDSLIDRQMKICTDNWRFGPVKWTHYDPYFAVKDIEEAPADSQKLFAVPAGFIEVDSLPSPLLFAIQSEEAEKVDFTGFTGICYDSLHYILVEKGKGRVIDHTRMEGVFNLSGAALALEIEPTPEPVDIYVIHYNDAVHTGAFDSRYYYTSLFSGPEEVAEFVHQNIPVLKSRCKSVDREAESRLNDPYRLYMAGHSVHSYRYSTMLFEKPDRKLVWGVAEGQYGYINTLDLTVDQAFFELKFHPWTVRNELDLFSQRYFYHDSIHNPVTGDSAVGGISFCHDMGMGTTFTPRHQSFYENKSHKVWMTQEELQNWILCAALYYHETGDDTWLKNNASLLGECLKSMQRRDNPDPDLRDGLTDFVTTLGRAEEITTYDALDPALKQTRGNLYIAVKSWAVYNALAYLFENTGRDDPARHSAESARLTAQSVISHFDTAGQYFPAIFDGVNRSKIIPAVEGLVYTSVLELEPSKDSLNSQLIGLLKTHLHTVLKPGICLDSTSHAWKLSSTSSNTWQSKVYLSQYVADNVLGMADTLVHGRIDAVQASFQALSAAPVAWSDQLHSNNGKPIGSKHYPRGVTSVLWW